MAAAERIEIQDLTIPSGTLIGASINFPLFWREGYPVFIEFMFPPGPSGLVGLQLRHSGSRIIPRRSGQFLVGNDITLKYELDSYPYNASYSINAYNEGAYDHTIQVRVGLIEIYAQSLTRASGTLIPLPVTAPGALLEGSEVS